MNPIILLVCREEESLNLLRNMGVDISGWRSGIRDLFLPDSGGIGFRTHSSPRRGDPSHSRQSSLSTNSHSPTHQRYRNRSRSRSPDRADRRHSASTSSSSQSYAPVYVLDVRQLYVKLMQVTKVDGVFDIARFFKLTDEDGWCAGNESASVGFSKKNC